MKRILYLLVFALFTTGAIAQQGWKQYTQQNSNIGASKINKLLKTSTGEVWLATSNGLSKFDNGSFSNYTTTNGLLHNNVVALNEDSQGNIWLGYGDQGGGVTKFNSGNFTHYNSANGMHYSKIQSIFKLGAAMLFMREDGEGDVYNGTSFSDVSLGNGKMAQLNTNEVAFFSGKELKKYNGGTITTIPSPYSSFNFFSTKSFTSPAVNELFIFTTRAGSSGLIREVRLFKNGAFSLVDTKEIFSTAVKDVNGNYWLGNISRGMVTKVENNQSSYFQRINGYNAFYFNDVITKGNNVLFASENGLLEGSIENKVRNIEYVDINNLLVPLNANGAIGAQKDDKQLVFSTSDSQSIFFTSKLWMGGKSASGQLHVAGDRFPYYDNYPGSISKNDYEPGPVATDNILRHKNGRVWKVSKAEITYHTLNYMYSNYQMPESIKNWPAHGNTSVGEAACLAPFHDMDQDGQYEPEEGDYPHIRGDQAVYAISNDNIVHHSGGVPLKVEIHTMAYAYDSPQIELKNTVFMNHRIINRSAQHYNDFYIGSFADFDLGNPRDDYTGCDSNLSLYYVYNGDNDDENNGGNMGFGVNPPAAGVTFLNKKMGSYMYFNNDNGTLGDPKVANEYYNYMRGFWKDGTDVVYGGTGHMGSVPAPYTFNKYMFSGNPSGSIGWSEISAGNTPGDRRGIGATGPYSLPAGGIIELDLAYILSRNITKTANENVDLLKTDVQFIRQFYNNQTYTSVNNICGLLSVEEETTGSLVENKISVYPSPGDGQLTIASTSKTLQKITVLSLDGRVVLQAGINTLTHSLDISNEPAGIYFIQVESGGETETHKVIVN